MPWPDPAAEPVSADDDRAQVVDMLRSLQQTTEQLKQELGQMKETLASLERPADA